MSSNCNKNNAPRNGTNRLNRLPKALEASFIAIDERNKEALYQFVERLSKYINYHCFFDGATQQSTWQNVFNLNEINDNGLTEPHLALFDAFLDLYTIAQRDLNHFTAKHLDYFFETVLGFEKKATSPDRLYLTIELAKHITQHVLNDKTEFKADKNSDKKEQFYKLLSEFSFSHAQVRSIKSILIDSVEKSIIYASPIANSQDGKGEEILKADKSWDAFGNDKREKAKIGFAISSPLFRMAEGQRKITLDIEYAASNAVIPVVSKTDFKALVSAEKGWEQISIQSADFITSKILRLVLFANESNQKIIDYNAKVHIDDYRVVYPVVKIEINPSQGFYSVLMHASVENIQIKTDVKGIKNLLVQNSLGKLDASKPMEIFGSIPTIGANFYIGSNEVFQHELTTLNINFEFLNLPGMAFNNFYKSYAEPAKLFEFLPIVVLQNVSSYAASLAKKDNASKVQAIESKSMEDVTPVAKTEKESINPVSAQVYHVIPKYWEQAEIKKLFSNYVNNTSFKAEIAYLNHRNWLPLAPQKVNLFGTSDNTSPIAQFKASLTIPDALKSNYDTNV